MPVGLRLFLKYWAGKAALAVGGPAGWVVEKIMEYGGQRLWDEIQKKKKVEEKPKEESK
jgi:hypothetical protein